MKKIIKYTLSAIIAIGVLSSCGKTTKKKMDGDWTIYSYENTSKYENNYIYSLRYSGNTVTSVDGDEHITGNLHKAVWSIHKDGTWEREVSYTLIDKSGDPHIVKKTTTIVSSGTWEFITSVDKEYKKNEQVVFIPNKTSEKTRHIDEVSGEVMADYSYVYDYNYETGDLIDENEYYQVITSEKDKLVLGYEGTIEEKFSNGDYEKADITVEYSLTK